MLYRSQPIVERGSCTFSLPDRHKRSTREAMITSKREGENFLKLTTVVSVPCLVEPVEEPAGLLDLPYIEESVILRASLADR